MPTTGGIKNSNNSPNSTSAPCSTFSSFNLCVCNNINSKKKPITPDALGKFRRFCSTEAMDQTAKISRICEPAIVNLFPLDTVFVTSTYIQTYRYGFNHQIDEIALFPV